MMTEQTETHTSPERYCRIAITKNSKGYSHETTVSLRWSGDDFDYIGELNHLNGTADLLAREEIAAREADDNSIDPKYTRRQGKRLLADMQTYTKADAE